MGDGGSEVRRTDRKSLQATEALYKFFSARVASAPTDETPRRVEGQYKRRERSGQYILRAKQCW